ncbi:hypothetical protein ALC56_06783 [Trachymyrmex septentrionalis]|uniref:Uncharacterized protein n=1 Tax=Trachymyrmex septentrionalis TaxID=34720 RepID=A0A195FFI3_9HYME|nr:hypothetical protein ALC56_06783 [Trachymyrmex septentrionalis]
MFTASRLLTFEKWEGRSNDDDRPVGSTTVLENLTIRSIRNEREFARNTNREKFHRTRSYETSGLLVPAVERRHPILHPDTPYANLRKSAATRNYGHKDLRLCRSTRNRESTASWRTVKSESPETEREEGGKAERDEEEEEEEEEEDISRVLKRNRRGSKRRAAGLRKRRAGQNVERSGC